jgi:hypothetical protein
MDYIAKQLQPLAVGVESLTLDPRNARLHGRKNMDTVKSSLTRFGQRLPIVVQKEGMVVRVGNARLTAAREMGWTHIAAVIVDENDVEATAFALVDNRSSELGEWDMQILCEELQNLEGVFGDLEELGWKSDALELLLEANWEVPELDQSVLPPGLDYQSGSSAAHGNAGGAMALTAKQQEMFDNVKELLQGIKGQESFTPAQCIDFLCKFYLQKKGIA